MQFSTSTFMALAAIIPFVSAHMQVNYPPVFAGPQTIREGEHLNPLHPDGSNYPCYDTVGLYTPNGPAVSPTYDAGTTQRFDIFGSATHGGGSCQISITYDAKPTKDSKFYVLKSFHGDCPLNTGGNLNSQGTFPLEYKIPVNMPGGKAVIAWTWFNRVGNREMYMRCAPVNIKSDKSDHSVLNALPAMFKANIRNIGADSCTLPEGDLFRFPNPGSDVRIGSGTLLDVPAGCGTPEGTPTSPEVEPDVPEAETSQPAKPVLVGDETVVIADPPQEQPATTKPATPTVTVVPVKPDTPVKPGKPVPSTGRCSEDGAIICLSVSTWAICDHGAVVPMGNVADGLICKGGVMEFANSKRAIRGMKFGHTHRSRHHAGRRAL